MTSRWSALAVALVVVGCGGSSDRAAATAGLWTDDGVGGMDAALVLTPDRTETPDGSCWTATRPDGSVLPVIWPQGAVAVGDEVRLADGRVLRAGQEVEVGGGLLPPGVAFDTAPPPGCADLLDDGVVALAPEG